MNSLSNFVQNANLILFVLLLIAVIFELYLIMNLNSKLKRIRRRYDHLLRGRGEINLEELINSFGEDIDNNKIRIRDLEKSIGDANHKFTKAIQKVGLYRYNAFDDLTNELSYSLALLDSANDGVILTNIFGRESSQTYAKTIRSGKCDRELSREEMKSLDIALGAWHEQPKEANIRK